MVSDPIDTNRAKYNKNTAPGAATYIQYVAPKI